MRKYHKTKLANEGCSACGKRLNLETDLYAVESFGEVVCSDCFFSLYVTLLAQGVPWKGEVYGVEIDTRAFWLAVEKSGAVPLEL